MENYLVVFNYFEDVSKFGEKEVSHDSEYTEKCFCHIKSKSLSIQKHISQAVYFHYAFASQ